MKKIKLGFILSLLMALMLQLTVMAAGETITIQACVIQGDQVVVLGAGQAAAPDGNLYLFALKVYENGIGARTDYCAVVPATVNPSFMVPLELNTLNSKLYSRFVIAVNKGGTFVPVSTECYITNPEAAATAATTSIAAGIKKGLGLSWQDASYLSATGSKHTAVTVDIARLFNGGGFTYVYNGKPYEFNAVVVAEFDQYVNLYNKQQQNDITMLLTCSKNPAAMDLIYPAARGNTKAYTHLYAFNVSEQIPEEKYEAVISFLAERYSGGNYGAVMDYVVGNEVNSSDSWHYAGELTAEQFGIEYAKQFRVFYNAIKSHNLTANVYICTDQRWTHNDGGSSYGQKPVLESFNREIARTGNIDWGLSFHPYSLPLMHTKFWTDATPAYTKLKNHTDNSKMVTPLNMDVVTNKLSQPEFLSPTGAVRNMICSEVGISSVNYKKEVVEADQAAAIVYACKLMESNPYIKYYIINTLRDNAAEGAQGLAFGLINAYGTPKPAYAAFTNLYTDSNAQYLPIIGASSWQQLGVN